MNTNELFRKSLARFRLSEPELYNIILSNENMNRIREIVETKLGKRMNTIQYQDISLDFLSRTLERPSDDYSDLRNAVETINLEWIELLYDSFNETRPSIQQFYQKSAERGFLQRPSEIETSIVTQVEKRIERPDPIFLGNENPLKKNVAFGKIFG